MNIQLEGADRYSVQAYSNNSIQINSVIYDRNLIVCPQAIEADWKINTIHELIPSKLEFILAFQPEVIIIGHNLLGKFPLVTTLQQLSQQRIGLEAMSIGAACRTYNVLLSEDRRVVLGIIF